MNSNRNKKKGGINNINIEDDKIIINAIDFNKDNLDLKGYDPKALEIQDKIYKMLCSRMGLDPNKGQIILEKSKDDVIQNDTDTIKIDLADNKAVISENEFNEYLTFHKKLQKDMGIENEMYIKPKQKSNNDKTLELILKIQKDILQYIQDSVSDD